MTPRERFVNTLTFNPADRFPLVEWPVREATLTAWAAQGYPDGIEPGHFFALDPFSLPVGIDLGMRPKYRERTLERTGDYRIWIDALGAKRKDFAETRTPGFVTRSWLEFPVKCKADFLRMKKRYVASDSLRAPEKWKAYAAALNASPVPTQLTIPFLFWTARDWMGFENLCMAFYDQAGLVSEMFEFITDFTIETLKPLIGDILIDFVMLNEDMAYKHAPMISPELFRQFMQPSYIRLIAFLKSNGVKLVGVDSDGYPGGLIPRWLECGVDMISPCEIAAGNDLLRLRREYPELGLLGGIDKRLLAADFKAIDAEVLGKVPALAEKGGYIPHVDHAVPPDVPLHNFIHYRELLSKIAGGEM